MVEKYPDVVFIEIDVDDAQVSSRVAVPTSDKGNAIYSHKLLGFVYLVVL